MPFHAGDVGPDIGDAPGTRLWAREWLAAGGAAVLSVLLYAGTLDNPFVYDDFRLIVENPAIQQLADIRTVLVRDITRPLVNLTYVSDTALWGTRPFGYHLTNVVLHALNVVVVFWLAFAAATDWRRSGGGRYGFSPSPRVVAVVTSVLVAAHPIATQAVGYVTARSELLYGFFFLLSWLAARHWIHEGGWWRSATVVFWVLSLLAKEAAAMLPVVLWCYDAWVVGGDRAARLGRIRRLYAPLLIVVLLFAGGRLAVLATIEYPADAGPSWRYVLVTVEAFWRYLRLLVWPTGQSIMHMIPAVSLPRAIAGVGGLAAFAAVIWSLRRVQGLVSIGLAVTAVMLLPSSVLFITGVGEPMAEHRAYVSAMGFFLACGAITGMVWTRISAYGRGTLTAAAIGIVCVAQLAGLTLVRNAVWDSPVNLAREAVARSPGHWLPRLLLGETLRQSGRCGEAVPEYRLVVSMRGLEAFTYKKLLGCLLVTNQVAEAEQVLHELRAIEPASPEAAMGMGLLAFARGQLEQSRHYFAEIITRDPRHQEARQFVALLDGSLAEPERRSLCSVVLALAPAASARPSGAAPPTVGPCP